MEPINHTLQPWHLEPLGDQHVPRQEDFLGKPLLILFFYLGCPGCIGRAIPFANRMAFEYGEKISVVGIHSNTEGPEYSDEELLATLSSLHVRFPVYKDAGFATTFFDYQAAGTPHWMLVNGDGRIIRSIFGSDPNRALLRLDYAIREELGGKAIVIDSKP